MATLKDAQNFKKYKVLYAKALDGSIKKEEKLEMDALELLLKSKIGEFIYDENDTIVLAKSRGKKLSVPKRLGFQNHHLIPCHSEIIGHSIWEKAGMSVHDKENILQLPSKPASYIGNKNETLVGVPVHEGAHVDEVKSELQRNLEDILAVGSQRDWSKIQYKEALIDLMILESQRCLKNPTRLNRTAFESHSIVSKTLKLFQETSLSFVLTTSLALGGAGLAKEEFSIEPHPLVDFTIHRMVYGATKGLNHYPFRPALLLPKQPNTNIVWPIRQISTTSTPQPKPKPEAPKPVIKQPAPRLNAVKKETNSSEASNSNSNLHFQYRPKNNPQKPKTLEPKAQPNKTTERPQPYKANLVSLARGTSSIPYSQPQKPSSVPTPKQPPAQAKNPLPQKPKTAQPHEDKQKNVPGKASVTMQPKKAIAQPQKAREPVKQQSQTQQAREQARRQQQVQAQQRQQIQAQQQRAQIQQQRQQIQAQQRQQQLQMQQTREQARRQQPVQAQQRQQARVQQQQQIQQAREQARRQQQLQLQQAREQACRQQQIQAQQRQQAQAQQRERARVQQQQMQQARMLQQQQARMQQQQQQLMMQRQRALNTKK